MRQPLVSLVLAGGLLIAALVPAFALETGFAGVSTLPEDLRSKEGFDVLDSQFSAGNVTPAEVVIEGEMDSPSVRAGLEALKAALAADVEQAFDRPRPLEVNGARTIALLSVTRNWTTVNKIAGNYSKGST